MSKRKTKKPVNDIEKANKVHLQPKNHNQKIYLDYLNTQPQIFALGPAGTGKTFLASAVAAKKFLNGTINKIIITRPRVEVDEEWGALPGALHRKTQPWAFPVVEVLEEFMGKERCHQAQIQGEIEVLPLAFMRGRTLDNAFCILDEAQNTTVNQMKMFVTRIGENSTILINGDIAQTDIKKGSGLAWALGMLNKYNLPAKMIEFSPDDVARSAVCGAWVKAMYEEEKVLSKK